MMAMKTRQPRQICDVRTAIKGLESGRSDDFIDMTSDNLINRIELLFLCLSNI